MAIFTVVIGVGFMFCDIPNILAQETSEEFTLEEITVTAQKRAENQQKVPIAMEVISGDTLKEIGRNDIDKILGNVSSVLIQSNTDGLRVSIRGMSNDNAPMGGVGTYTPTVAVNTDGVFTNMNGNNQNMYDVERVEVLYGPQNTLYATASPGGIVNVITADPTTDKYEGSGTLEYGNYNLLHTEGSVNAPLNDKIAVRAAFSTTVHDGYLSNGSMDEDIKSARLKTSFKPNEKFSMVVTGEISKSGGQGFANVKAFVNQDDAYYPDGTKLTDPWASSSSNAGAGTNKVQKKISAHMDLELGDAGTLSVIPSYVKSNSSSSSTQSSGSSASAVVYDSTNQGITNEKGVEARMVSSEGSSFKWILGGNFYNFFDKMSGLSISQTNSSDISTSLIQDKEESKSIYGSLTYPVTDRFRATAGARKSWDKNTSYVRMTPGRDGSPEEIHGGHMDYTKPNFKVGVEYDLSDNSMLYTDWSSSYRMNGATPTGMDPEEVKAYTAGAKNRFFDKKLQLNVSAYYYDYRNYFANMGPLFAPVDSDNDGIWESTYEVDNKRIGDAAIYGLDLQTSTIISAYDKLDLSVSYIKKYFKKLNFDFPQIVNDLGIDDLDYDGMDMPQAPNWNVTASYNHNFMLPNGGTLKAVIDARYTSETCLNWEAKSLSLNLEQDASGNYTGGYTTSVTDTSNIRWQKAYHIENISLVYANPDGKWTFSGYVNNLGNYAVKQFLDGRGSLMIGNPRTFGAVLSVKF